MSGTSSVGAFAIVPRLLVRVGWPSRLVSP